MYLIDTNIFLEVLIEQENSDNCKKLLESIAEGETEAAVSEFTVHGIEGMLTDNLEALDKFLTNVTSLINLNVAQTDTNEERQIVELAKSKNLDFDDALQYAVAKRENISTIVSYDTDFDKTDLERVKPEKVIK